MPGMIVCFRKLLIGSDDLVYPMMLKILYRILWLICLSIFLGTQWNNFEECEHEILLKIFVFVLIIFLLLAILMNTIIMIHSMQGSIIDLFNRRKYVSHLLVIKLVLLIPELSWYIVGTIWIHTLDATHCSFLILWTYKCLIYVAWGFIALHLFGIIFTFGLFSHSRNEELRNVENSWKTRCFLFSCGFRHEDKKNAFADVTKFLSEYFKDVDLVATDIMSGLILLQLAQKHAPQRLVKYDVVATPKPWMNVPLALHYIDFALSCYGWMFFVYDNNLSGPCKIFIKSRCCSCIRIKKRPIHDDNCCRSNISAILSQTKIKIEDIIYANFTNQIYETPFYVSLDHQEKSIVVAIRGSLSFYDAITDLTLESQCINFENMSDAYVHKGINQAATYVKAILENHNILEDAFHKTPDYKLVITGHSLGAGAAALLAIMLRPKYPNLICFAYSPPGWLINLPLLRHTEDFILSVVVGKDFIPRAGINTMNLLKVHLQQVIRNSNVPKYKILMSGIMKKLCGCAMWTLHGGAVMVNEDNQSDSLVVDSTYPPHHSYTEEDIIVETSENESLNKCQVLYMPGQVMHLEEAPIINKRRFHNKRSYIQSWRRSENFDEILVSTRMLTDHLPNKVKMALSSAALGFVQAF